MANSLLTKVKINLILELLMQNLLVIFASNAFVTPLTYLFPPYYFYLLIQRKLLLKKFNNNIAIEMNQKEANE
jgi:hypothetical protein